MKRFTSLMVMAAAAFILFPSIVSGQDFGPEKVFSIDLFTNQETAVADSKLQLAVEITIDPGWHINSDNPGDEFSLPTTVTWTMPEGWPEPTTGFPEGETITFDFSDEPIEVWAGRVFILGEVDVPAAGEAGEISVEVVAQACNNTRCLPPTPARSKVDTSVAAAGAEINLINEEIFSRARNTGDLEKAHGDGAPRVSTTPTNTWLWFGAVCALIGLFILVILRLGHRNPFADRLMRFISLVLVAAGSVLIASALTPEKTHLDWTDFDVESVRAAIADEGPVILDFSATWCAPCRELDEKTFSHPDVADILATYQRFKADITEVNDQTDAWRQEYGVAGVPTVIVFKEGQEVFRITGFEEPEIFVKRLGGAVVDDDVGQQLASTVLPLQILLVFLAGLALNLTPCIYPLIPITIGFFSQQAKDRPGGTFGLAVAYVLGISVTYSVVGVVAAMTGQLFGSALQNPWVIGIVVIVLLALALSMFGLWELRVPGWATKASGGRGGYVGSLLMGLMVGFVAAPCIGPFVLGLITYVGQQGSPVLGFVLFFSLSMGLGLPYLLLGTFAGAVNKLPASGMWMIGVRKVFGILLVALAAYFANPLLMMVHPLLGDWIMSAVLVIGGAYLLLVERTGNEQIPIDRAMRLVSTVLVVAGIVKII